MVLGTGSWETRLPADAILPGLDALVQPVPIDDGEARTHVLQEAVDQA